MVGQAVAGYEHVDIAGIQVQGADQAFAAFGLVAGGIPMAGLQKVFTRANLGNSAFDNLIRRFFAEQVKALKDRGDAGGQYGVGLCVHYFEHGIQHIGGCRVIALFVKHTGQVPLGADRGNIRGAALCNYIFEFALCPIEQSPPVQKMLRDEVTVVEFYFLAAADRTAI